MEDAEILALSREAARKAGGMIWCIWITSQPGKYATEAEALAAADEMQLEQKRCLFEYGISRNLISGWDVVSYSCDG